MLITLLFSLWWTSPAQAIESQRWYVGVSYYSQNTMNKTTKSPDGKGSTMGQTYYPIGLGYAFTAGPQSSFVPSLEYTVIPRTSPDGGTKASLMMINLPYVERFGQDWDWTLGLSLIRYTLKGKGGTKVLNNGSGTATFGLPGRTVTTMNYATQLAIGYNLESFRFQLGTNILAMLSNDRRAYDLFLMLQYKFGGGM